MAVDLDERAWFVPRSMADTPGDLVERFSADEMARQLRVLFIMHQPDLAPGVAVHADLIRFLNHDRVRPYVAMSSAVGTGKSMGRTVRGVIAQIPEVAFREVSFGPVTGEGRRALLTSAAKTAIPTLRDFGALVRFVRRERIAVIHCEYQVFNGFYAYLLSRLTGVPYLVHLHSNYGDWMRGPVKFAVEHADAIIAVSLFNGDTARTRGQIAATKIFPVLNGIDVSRWDPAASGHEVRREFGLEPEDPLIVQVAQVTHWKRQCQVIEAFGQIQARYPKARLMLVGLEWDRPYSAELRRLVADQGLQSKVIFAGARSDIAAILAAADLVAHPPVGEPFGLAFLEAMAMCTPIVSVRSGATSEVVQEDATGLLGEPDNPHQLAANMIALLDDPRRRAVLGQAGREQARDRFGVQRMADGVEAVYRRLVAKHR